MGIDRTHYEDSYTPLHHHPDCPCCEYKRQLEVARRSVRGLLKCRVSEEIIVRELTHDGLWGSVIEEALTLERSPE